MAARYQSHGGSEDTVDDESKGEKKNPEGEGIGAALGKGLTISTQGAARSSAQRMKSPRGSSRYLLSVG